MIELIYIFALSLGILSIGLAGIGSDRHLVIILLGVELVLIASTIALVSFFSYNASPNPEAVVMLFAIFAVAAAEVITVITFYIYMKSRGLDFDVSKLTRLKW